MHDFVKKTFNTTHDHEQDPSEVQGGIQKSKHRDSKRYLTKKILDCEYANNAKDESQIVVLEKREGKILVR